MTIKEIYSLAIKMGIKADPRSETRIKKLLGKENKKYQELKAEEKELYDVDRLINPFSDSRILTGDKDKKVKRVMAGIDIEAGELMMAQFLGRHQGRPVDLVVAHHPDGIALASGLDDVMKLQADLLHQYGIPINIAESLLEKRISEVARRVSAINHNKPVDAAKILNIPLMCVHTPTDNLVYDFLNREIKKKEKDLETVGDVMEFLKTIPEYREAIKLGAGPKLFVGHEARRAGKIALTEITGGTSGSKNIYEKLSQAGIGTIIGMHMGEEHREEAEKNHINVIIAGHISSDSLGLNLFLDELEKKGIEVVPCSGLIRISRNKKKLKNKNRQVKRKK